MLTNNILKINWIRQALECGTKGMRKLLVGDLNAYLENPRDPQEEKTETFLSVYGLLDQAHHFLPIGKYRAEENCTWRIWR